MRCSDGLLSVGEEDNHSSAIKTNGQVFPKIIEHFCRAHTTAIASRVSANYFCKCFEGKIVKHASLNHSDFVYTLDMCVTRLLPPSATHLRAPPPRPARADATRGLSRRHSFADARESAAAADSLQTGRQIRRGKDRWRVQVERGPRRVAGMYAL